MRPILVKKSTGDPTISLAVVLPVIINRPDGVSDAPTRTCCRNCAEPPRHQT